MVRRFHYLLYKFVGFSSNYFLPSRIFSLATSIQIFIIAEDICGKIDHFILEMMNIPNIHNVTVDFFNELKLTKLILLTILPQCTIE